MDFSTAFVLTVLIICLAITISNVFGPVVPAKELTKEDLIQDELKRLHRLLDDTYFSNKTWAAAEVSKLHDELIKMKQESNK